MASFQIFLSYKEQDGNAVEEARRALLGFAKSYLRLKPPQDRNAAAECFEVFMARAPDAVAHGDEWRRKVTERLKTCDVFLLFYTTANTDWSWCLYEAGLFAGRAVERGRERERRLLCVHTSGGRMPSQLSELQATVGTPDSIRGLLEAHVVGEVGLAPGVDAGDAGYAAALDRLVERFYAVFRPYEGLYRRTLADDRALLPRATIRCPLDRVADVPDMLRHATVVFAAGANKIFGLPEGQVSFPDFADRLADKRAWEADLRASIAKLVDRANEIEPGQTVIDVVQRGGRRRLYRPLLTDVRSSANALQFGVCFVELLDDPPDEHPTLDRCFKLLRIIHSFRMSVAERVNKVAQHRLPMSADDRAELAQNLSSIMARYVQYDLNAGRDPTDGMSPCTRSELFALGDTFAEAAAEIERFAATGEFPPGGLATAAWKVDFVNLAWLRAVAPLYVKHVEQLAATRAPGGPAIRFVRFAVVLNGNAKNLRHVRDGFVQAVRAALRESRSVPIFEEAEGVVEANRDAQNRDVFEELFARCGQDRSPDYLVTIGTQVSQYAKRHYLGRFPIVFVAVTDPVRAGLVEHLRADPGRGDLCGVTFGLSTDSRMRLLERQFAGKRLGFIYNPEYPQDVAVLEQIEEYVARERPRIEVVPLAVRYPELTDDQTRGVDLFFGWDYLSREFPAFLARHDLPFIGPQSPDGPGRAVAMIGNADDRRLGEAAARDIVAPHLMSGRPLCEIPIQSPQEPGFEFNPEAARAFGIHVSSLTKASVKSVARAAPDDEPRQPASAASPE